MIILAIETSCDETSAALLKNGKQILSNLVASQEKLHAQYGGIVPEVAAREHIKIILPIINETLKRAKISLKDIDYLAVTVGPGLISSLMIGVDTAKTFAFILKKTLIAINHLEGHIYSNWLNKKLNNKHLFPLLCLIVSGGHTQLVLMKNHGEYKIIGETRDDAAGEAFDKVAKILKIGYPGGPIIEKLAKQGNVKTFDLPRPMIKQKNFDFSFSGLKTAVIDVIRSQKLKVLSRKFIQNMSASFQQAVIDVLVEKTIRAAKKYQVKTIMIGGGVAANKSLRKTFKRRIKKELPQTRYSFPQKEYCSDNAAMIAQAAYFLKEKRKVSWQKIKTDPNLRLK